MSIDKKSEGEFQLWLESIEFIEEDGKVLEPVLEDDDSSDPEGDRE